MSRYPTVYTDGSCHSNGRDGARAGVGVHWGEGHPDNISSGLSGAQTNQRAELEAASRGIETAKSRGYGGVTVETDSHYVVKGATEWMDNWKSNGWKTYSGGDVKNKSDFQRLDRAMKDMDVTFKYVPGHKGHPGNEAANRLANQGARGGRY